MPELQVEFVNAVKQLEPLPPTVARLAALLSRSDWGMKEIEECIAFDQALTTKLLRLANSALWFRSHAIGTVRDAVMRIGSGTVLALVTGAGVQRRLVRALPEYGLKEGDLWRHSVASALAASVLDSSTDVDVPAEAYVGALLHDIGKLIMSRVLASRPQVAARERAVFRGDDCTQTEIEVTGLDHSALGGVVASHWKLSDRIVTAITYHHTPLDSEDAIAAIVHAADYIAHRTLVGGEREARVPGVTASVLEKLKLRSVDVDRVVEEVGEELEDVLRRYA